MYYRNSFQKTVATSKFTLPVVAVISAIFWFMSFKEGTKRPDVFDMGLWQHIPSWMTDGWGALGMGVALSLLTVYLMAEFNNKFVLLRISSRMLSSTLATLLTMCVFLHHFQPAHIVLTLIMTAYFPLFFSYQRTDSMPLIFMVYLMISAASLVAPKLLLITPVYWIAQISLRSFTIRTFFASLFGIITPLWLLIGTAYISGTLESTCTHFIGIFQFEKPDFNVWSMHQWLSLALVTLMGLLGSLNFYRRSYLDKTRTRINMGVAVIMFIASLVLLLLETAHFNEIFPLVLINASILSGHHLASECTRFSNIYTIIICILIACVAYTNYIGL